MTAKILATAGALGFIATIWTGDLRYLWTGIILLLISIGIAANKDKRRKEQPDHLCAQAWQDGHDTALINGQSQNPYEQEPSND